MNRRTRLIDVRVRAAVYLSQETEIPFSKMCTSTVLWGVEYQGGKWWVIDTTTGVATFTGWSANAFGPRDLAGGSCTAGPNNNTCTGVQALTLKAPRKVRPGKQFRVAVYFKLEAGSTLPVGASATLALPVLPSLTFMAAKAGGVFNQNTSVVTWPVDSFLTGGRKARRAGFFSATLRLDPSVSTVDALSVLFYIQTNSTVNCFTQITVSGDV